MATFSLSFTTDNAAFSEYGGDEVARILQHIASTVEGIPPTGQTWQGSILDVNGNGIGAWRWESSPRTAMGRTVFVATVSAPGMADDNQVIGVYSTRDLANKAALDECYDTATEYKVFETPVLTDDSSDE